VGVGVGLRGAWKFAEIILSAKPHAFTEKQSTAAESDSAFHLKRKRADLL